MASNTLPPPGDPLIPQRKHAELRRLADYFGWRSLRVEWRGTPRQDISVAPGADGRDPTVYVGPRWVRRGRPLLALAHEGVHGAGYEHSAAMRGQGFWSKDRRRDTLTDAVYTDALAGTPHFDPQRFGLPVPARSTGRRPR